MRESGKSYVKWKGKGKRGKKRSPWRRRHCNSWRMKEREWERSKEGKVRVREWGRRRSG